MRSDKVMDTYNTEHWVARGERTLMVLSSDELCIIQYSCVWENMRTGAMAQQ